MIRFYVGLLTFVNCWDVKWSTWVQDTFTYAKLVALFIIMGTGVYQLCTGMYCVIWLDCLTKMFENILL